MPRRRSRRRVSTAAQAGSQKKRQKRLMFGGVGAAVIVAVVLLVALVAGRGGPAEAADFRVSMYQGIEGVGGFREINLSQLRGKPLVLNFWAALCPPCRAEMPGFQQFYDQSQDDITLLGVDIGPFMGFGDSSHREADRLLRDLGITYPTGSTNDGSVTRKFRITAMPTTVFINSNGEIFERRSGALSPRDLTRTTSAMLASESRVGQDHTAGGGS